MLGKLVPRSSLWARLMGHSLPIVIAVLRFAIFVFAVTAILFDLSDTTGLPIPHPKVDWWSLFFGALAISAFTGLAYVIWSSR